MHIFLRRDGSGARLPRAIGVLLAAGVLGAGLSVALVEDAFAQQAPKPQQNVKVAQAQQKPAARRSDSSPLGGLGGDSKEPIKIDADKLDVLDKENRAVFRGNVVAVQGETTVRCSTMTVFYEGRGGPGAPARPAAPAGQTGNAGNDSSIKRIECAGPVTVVSKTQAATSDHAIFDRANNVVIMTGNVAVNDGPNVTRGEKLTYNTVTGVANVETNKGGRVQGFFVPGSGEQQPGGKPGAKPPTN